MKPRVIPGRGGESQGLSRLKARVAGWGAHRVQAVVRTHPLFQVWKLRRLTH